MQTPLAAANREDSVVVRMHITEALELIHLIYRASRIMPPRHPDSAPLDHYIGPVSMAIEHSIGEQCPALYREHFGRSIEEAGVKCDRLQPLPDNP